MLYHGPKPIPGKVGVRWEYNLDGTQGILPKLSNLKTLRKPMWTSGEPAQKLHTDIIPSTN